MGKQFLQRTESRGGVSENVKTPGAPHRSLFFSLLLVACFFFTIFSATSLYAGQLRPTNHSVFQQHARIAVFQGIRDSTDYSNVSYSGNSYWDNQCGFWNRGGYNPHCDSAQPSNSGIPIVGVILLTGGFVAIISIVRFFVRQLWKRRQLFNKDRPKTRERPVSGQPENREVAGLNGWQRLGVCLSVPWVIFVFLFFMAANSQQPSPQFGWAIATALISLAGLWILAYLILFAVRWVWAGFSNSHD